MLFTLVTIVSRVARVKKIWGLVRDPRARYNVARGWLPMLTRLKCIYMACLGVIYFAVVQHTATASPSP